MCGVLGIVGRRGAALSVDDGAVAAMRDAMAHRGPDGFGLWRRENCVLAHRRLSVVDLTDSGAQPMVTEGGELALVYNGELYNDGHLRAGLVDAGAAFAGSCDTETVLRGWRALSCNFLQEMRGMFALGVWDVRAQRLTLARDPLGVKPLYFARTTSGPEEIVFASEPWVVAMHPGVGARVNWRMVGAYLTTIRTVLGTETMYAGVEAVRPGEVVEIDCGGEALCVRRRFYWRGSPEEEAGAWSAERAADETRRVMEDSVAAHLRADVETCALLSGGLDSTVIAATARGAIPDLRTYCAGAREGSGAEDDDLDVARRAAAFLGTRHEEAVVTREGFAERWRWMVGRQRVPLSTPNEVAIYGVASRLREDGCVVTVSGEGADELFAGYDLPLRGAMAYRAAAARGEDGRGPGGFELESNAWVGPRMIGAVLREEVSRGIEGGAWTASFYEDEFARAREEVGGFGDALSAHLRFQRRVNLTGLLQRLDTATMLASVEGRTAFADARVAGFAERVPLAHRFVLGGGEGSLAALAGFSSPTPGLAALGPPPQRGGGRQSPRSGEDVFVGETRGGTAEQRGVSLGCGDGGVVTKACLRRAFAGVLPREVVGRAKRSFPLPFRDWVGDSVGVLRESSFAREAFGEAAIEMVCERPRELWNLAWPMVNVAMWGDGMGEER